MQLLEEMNRAGLTLVVVTHDVAIAERARRIVRLDDGEIVEDRLVAGGRSAPYPGARTPDPGRAGG
jgi:energy-coupling factor transporter ATP-binding protein EcfA2